MDSRETQDLELIEIEIDRDRYHEQLEIVRWCDHHFGSCYPFSESNKRWRWESMFGSTFFYFKQEKDAILFSLKWL